MNHKEFSIGLEFYTATGKWRCTDVGTRTIVAIHLASRLTISCYGAGEPFFVQGADDSSWFNGPPYALDECVFDELDMGGCYLGSECAQTETK